MGSKVNTVLEKAGSDTTYVVTLRSNTTFGTHSMLITERPDQSITILAKDMAAFWGASVESVSTATYRVCIESNVTFRQDKFDIDVHQGQSPQTIAQRVADDYSARIISVTVNKPT